MEWRENEGVRWLQADLGGAIAAFPTRLGGVSPAPYDSLNLGLLTDDTDANAIENRRRLAAALGFAPERIAHSKQVHGTELTTPAESMAEADGQILTKPGTAALVFTADCLPIAVRGPGGVALLHCGWRGLAGGIVARGAAAVGATGAAIGPGIGACCYEVGEEVLGAFATLGEGVAEGRMLDLAEAARRLLRAAGVESTESAGLCTSCNPELFFSHRRDAGLTGRQGAVAWLSEEVS